MIVNTHTAIKRLPIIKLYCISSVNDGFFCFFFLFEYTEVEIGLVHEIDYTKTPIEIEAETAIPQ